MDEKCQVDANNSSNEDHEQAQKCTSENNEHAQNCTNGNFELQNKPQIKNQRPQQAKNYRRKNISQKTRIVVFEKARTNSSLESGISLGSADIANNSTICCQYNDPTTGKICRSHHQLEVDYIQPVWAGGSDDADNLQILCRAHNQFKYQQQAGFYL